MKEVFAFITMVSLTLCIITADKAIVTLFALIFAFSFFNYSIINNNMKYENRQEVESILNDIAKTEKKLNTTIAIRNSINSGASIELSASSVGFTIRVSLTDAQVKSITDNVIEECNKELNEYKEQLKDL